MRAVKKGADYLFADPVRGWAEYKEFKVAPYLFPCPTPVLTSSVCSPP
jgi:hypothetical protein